MKQGLEGIKPRGRGLGRRRFSSSGLQAASDMLREKWETGGKGEVAPRYQSLPWLEAVDS